MKKSTDQRQGIFLKLTFLTLILCLAQGRLTVSPAHSENLPGEEMLRSTHQELGESLRKSLTIGNNGYGDFPKVIALNKEKEAPEKTKAYLQKNKSAVNLNQKEPVLPKKKVACPKTEWGNDWTVQADGTIKGPDVKKFKRIQVKSLSNTKKHLGYLFKKSK